MAVHAVPRSLRNYARVGIKLLEEWILQKSDSDDQRSQLLIDEQSMLGLVEFSELHISLCTALHCLTQDTRARSLAISKLQAPGNLQSCHLSSLPYFPSYFEQEYLQGPAHELSTVRRFNQQNGSTKLHSSPQPIPPRLQCGIKKG